MGILGHSQMGDLKLGVGTRCSWKSLSLSLGIGAGVCPVEVLGQEVCVLESLGPQLRDCQCPEAGAEGRGFLAGPGCGFPALAIQSQISKARPSGLYNYWGGSCGLALEQGRDSQSEPALRPLQGNQGPS